MQGSISYSASTLTPGSSSNRKKQSKLRIKTKEEIIIPSVSKLTIDDATPRISPTNMQRSLSPKVRMTPSGDYIIEANHEMKSSLSVNHIDSKKNVRFNSTSPLTLDPRLLRGDDPNSVDTDSLSTISTHDNMSILSSLDTGFTPVHFSSGSAALVARPSVISPAARRQPRGNKGLWTSGGDMDMYEKELLIEKRKQEELLAEKLRLQREKDEAEFAQRMKMMKDKRLMARVVSLLFSRQFEFNEDLKISNNRSKFMQHQLHPGQSTEDVPSEPRLIRADSITQDLSRSLQVISKSNEENLSELAIIPLSIKMPLNAPGVDNGMLSPLSMQSPMESSKNPLIELNKLESNDNQLLSNDSTNEINKEKHEKKNMSKIREKLMTLGKFVLGHTNRKVMISWPLIETRFLKSPHIKIEMAKDAQGLVHPVKYNALTLSALVGLLCSVKVRVSFNELPGMFHRMGITDNDIMNARKIAAIRVVLGPNNGEGLKQALQLKLALQNLTKDEELLVHIEEFRNAVFPEDPIQRAEEMEKLERDRDKIMDSILEEKKKKDEIREMAEARKLKMIRDFADCVKILQYSRGPLTVHRHGQLQQLIAYCQRSIAEHNAEKDITIPEEVVSLLGMDAFPDDIRKVLTEQAMKRRQADLDLVNADIDSLNKGKEDSKMTMSRMTSKSSALSSAMATGGIKTALARVGFNGKFRLPIIGIQELLKQTVSFGKGLNGLAYRDVVEMLQAYSSTRIQAFVRGFMRRWRYFAARVKWRRIFHVFLESHFTAWSTLTRKNVDTRRYCWRRLTRWHYYTRRMKRRRYIFQCCFWPFYTWRKYSNRSAAAKEKARYLTTRVLPTYQTMLIFRAWKSYTKGEVHIRKLADDNFHRRNQRVMRVHLLWLHDWASRKKKIRRCWFKEGIARFQKRLFTIKNIPFQIWKAYVFYRVLLRKRIKSSAIMFHHLIFEDGRVLPAPNRTERRKLYEVIRLTQQAEEKKTKKGKKNKSQFEEAASPPPSARDDKGGSLLSRKKPGSQGGNRSWESLAAARLQALFKSRKPCSWKLRREQNMDFDIDSDGEDTENIPSNIYSLYQNRVEPLIEADDIEFMQIKDRFEALPFVRQLSAHFRFSETWGLLEHSLRFHRFAKRCFQNLRFYAKVRKNKRYSLKKYELHRKRVVFDALIGWMQRDPKYVKEEVVLTEAEVLANQVRSERIGRLLRRRQAAVEIKDILGRDFDDPKMEDPNAPPKKRISVFKDSDDSEPRKSKKDKDKDKDSKDKVDDAMSNKVQSKHNDNQSVVEEKSVPHLIHSAPSTPKRLSSPHLDSRPGSPLCLSSEAVAAVSMSDFPMPSDVFSPTATSSQDQLVSSLLQEASTAVTATTAKPSVLSSSVTTKTTINGRTYDLPDVLHWDREDREVELQLAERLIHISRTYRSEMDGLSIEADRKSIEMAAEYKKTQEIMKEIFAMEEQASNAAIINEWNYIDKFKIHSASQLVDVLEKIYREVQAALTKAETKKYFRALRMPMLENRGRRMLNRKRMINWIRICRRLIKIDERAEYYRKRRLQWIVFNRWLKYFARESINASPGLIRMLRRRVELHPSFSNDLKRKGFQKSVYLNNERLQTESADLPAVFYRWQMFVQEERIFARMEVSAAEAYRLKTLWKCFWAIRTGLGREEVHRLREQEPCIPLMRALSDLDQISKRFLSRRRHGLALVIKKYNRKFEHYQKKDGKESLSFKRFLKMFQWEVTKRLVTEQRILFESFEGRGTQEFADVMAPLPGDSCIPMIMGTLEGKKFADPTPWNAMDKSGPANNHLDTLPGIFSTNRLPGGFLLKKLRLNFQDNMGIVGWQVIWSADGTRDHEGPKRGKWNGAAMHVQELNVPKDDFVVGIEYLYEGATIMGLRFRLFRDGWTKWTGGKSSMSTLSTYISIDTAPRMPFEDEYVSPGLDEENRPAMPRNYVIGFTGVEAHSRSTHLGLVVRKVVEQHVFSYYWVNDALDKLKPAHDDEEDRDSLELQNNTALNQSDGSAVVSLPDISQSTATTATGSALTAASLPSHENSSTHSNYIETDKLDDGEYFDGSEDGSDDEGGSKSGDIDDDNEKTAKSEKSLATAFGAEPLTSSEEQFFDVVRMRLTEVKVAQIRVEKFARKIWTSKDIRNDPVMSKLTPVQICAGLSRWLFEALCKRLLALVKTEKKGTECMNRAHMLSLKAEIFERRRGGTEVALRELESEPQPWIGKSLLGPQERLARKQYQDKVKAFNDEIRDLNMEAQKLRDKALEFKKQGKLLLPRMQLSTYVCNNYKLKIAAARNKESLLERMDMEDIKNALCGTSNKDSSLSEATMETIKAALRNRPNNAKPKFSLEDLVEEELRMERERQRIETEAMKRSYLYFGTTNDSKVNKKSIKRTKILIHTMSTPKLSSSSSLVLNDDVDEDDNSSINSTSILPELKRSAKPGKSTSLTSSMRSKKESLSVKRDHPTAIKTSIKASNTKKR